MMDDCETTFRRMQDYLDRMLSPEETRRVRSHLDGCGICAEEYVFEAAILRRVRRSLLEEAVPDDLFARVSAALDRVS